MCTASCYLRHGVSLQLQARAASDASTMVDKVSDKMSVLSDLAPCVGLIRLHIP